jgi:hypothetical protein
MDKHSSLFARSLINEEKTFITLKTGANVIKNLFGTDALSK